MTEVALLGVAPQDPFWARGYFCVTAGELTKQMIEEYLEHHFEAKENPNFDIEP